MKLYGIFDFIAIYSFYVLPVLCIAFGVIYVASIKIYNNVQELR